MAKIFTKLNIGDTVATSGTKSFKKLTTIAAEEIEGGGIYLAANLFCNTKAEANTPLSVKMSTDGQLLVKGTPNSQNVDNLIVATGEFGGNVTAESADGINTTGTAEMKFAVCGRPTNGSIGYTRATDEWALGILGSAEPADTVESSGETTASIGTQAIPAEQEMTTMLFSTKGELNGTATHENAEVAEQVSSYASGELALIGQPVVKTACEVTFMVNGKSEHQTVVPEGEAPSDPVADGTIENTAKESTAQYHFHYAGWSRTEDGEPLDDLTVTEDTTFYAVYDKELRHYTISYYDNDGTLFESKTFAYGDIPSITDPEKDDYAFGGWSPPLAPVTGDADYVATWVEETYIMTGTLGSIVWTLSESGKLAFSGTGAMGGINGAYNQPWINYRDQIVSVKIGNGITSIGEQTLSKLKNVEELIIPEGVTSIDWYALVGSKFKRIYLPSTLTTIGTWAFNGVDAIEELHIADLTAYLNIKTGAQWGNVLVAASSVVNLYIAGELVKGLEIPSNITKIPAYAFRYCNLSYVKIHSNVNQIGSEAFYGATLENASFDATAGWWCATSATATSGTEIPSADLANTTTAATYLTTTYSSRYWFKT